MTEWMGQNSVSFYTGFLMDNNCHIIAETGQTQDWNMVCLFCAVVVRLITHDTQIDVRRSRLQQRRRCLVHEQGVRVVYFVILYTHLTEALQACHRQGYHWPVVELLGYQRL